MPDTAEQTSSPGAVRGMPRGLPMITARAPEALAAEREALVNLSREGALHRWRGYFAWTGPGWLQSAMTLGGGSAMASLFLGTFFGYQLLWLQPLAMILGVVMLSAVSHQTLSTGMRPFGAMKKHVHPAVAWAWVLATLVSTVIWHFPQYGLAAGMTEDMVNAATGWAPTGAVRVGFLLGVGLVVLIISTAITWSYGNGYKGIRWYENALKFFVWMIVLAFAAVVVRNTLDGRIRWGEVFRGFLPLHIPTDKRGVSTLMAAFGAAVGINMTFLFPYSLLARGWGKEHRALSRFDLVTGMFLPYTIATGLIVISAAAVLHGHVLPGAKLTPVIASRMIESAGVGALFARYVFGLGVLGMALSTITTHMLVNGFAFCEAFGIEPGGWKYKLACLTPTPGILGVVAWKYMGSWIAVPTSAICGLLLPIAYIGFFVLNNRRDYLGPDMPRGRRRLVWNVGMLIAIATATASSFFYLYTHFLRAV